MSTAPDRFEHAISRELRTFASKLPDVTEGTSCVNRAFKVGKRNFLFLGEKKEGVRVMLKLGDSADAAREMDNEYIGVGKGGWVTMLFPPKEAPPKKLLHTWIKESYTLFS